MSKIKKIIPIIIVIALIGGGYFLFTKGKGDEVSLPNLPTEPGIVSDSVEKAYEGTLKQMMALGVSLKCSWKRSDSDYGISYVKGEKVYTEMTMSGKTTGVIWADNCMWAWEEGNIEGTKMCFEESEITETPTGGSVEKGWGSPTDIGYNCQPTVVGDGKFTPPTGVQFLDLKEMMGGGMLPQ